MLIWKNEMCIRWRHSAFSTMVSSDTFGILGLFLISQSASQTYKKYIWVSIFQAQFNSRRLYGATHLLAMCNQLMNTCPPVLIHIFSTGYLRRDCLACSCRPQWVHAAGLDLHTHSGTLQWLLSREGARLRLQTEAMRGTWVKVFNNIFYTINCVCEDDLLLGNMNLISLTAAWKDALPWSAFCNSEVPYFALRLGGKSGWKKCQMIFMNCKS